MQRKDDKSTSLIGGEKEIPDIHKSDPSQGARPKIRNPKEAKRRRFVMKQAKTISKPQPLESVSESEEGQTLLPKSSDLDEPGPSKRGPEFFGVRSYVHTFYEAMAMDNGHGNEDVEGRFGYSHSTKQRRKRALCWRMTLASGVFILLMGIVAISVGFLVPKKKEVVDIQEDIEIIDKDNQAFNWELDICKIVGIGLFCAGGLIVTIVFIMLTVMWKDRRVDPLSAEEIPLTATDSRLDPVSSAPIDVKVPATEELTAVQPKRMDPDEVVMTNAGLCKIP